MSDLVDTTPPPEEWYHGLRLDAAEGGWPWQREARLISANKLMPFVVFNGVAAIAPSMRLSLARNLMLQLVEQTPEGISVRDIAERTTIKLSVARGEFSYLRGGMEFIFGVPLFVETRHGLYTYQPRK